mgnify:FL=1
MVCVYAPDLINQTEYTLSESESHHVTNVLRSKNNDAIQITNGQGKLFNAVIIDVHKKNTRVQITSHQTFTRQVGAVHLVIAPVKTNERLGFLLEKLTELDVASITPVLTQNGERRVFNHDKELYHLIAAIKQSKNPFLPVLHPLIKFEQYLTDRKLNLAQKLICHCRETPKQLLANTYKKGNDVIVCIGPEGDFTKEEVNFAEAHGFNSVSLGDGILRAETAGIAASIIVKTLNQIK